ncbi:hypothetical protein EHR_07195 [Enterococcus hirae ATCC 9790]|uniref:Lipoprotein n=1 Tax=Enterococcus hirae (strain ATCC 9790 / DSM 20160 / JCM 8729 / LMG 6399 / NBRC 3181 / NCIMB 6459 / NCDO 1258 / NCTC 12367 / WDCM 00089 / R) TaxID=768486 RepID=I6S125_ENTHA|nr:hypothetical protein EHR_07195 [Enterococcus hirae ATCC 9790]
MKKISLLLAIVAGIVFLSGCRNEKTDKDNWSTIQSEKKSSSG